MSVIVRQEAPDPTELRELVTALVYRDKWVFSLDDIDRGQGSTGLTLIIDITTQDGYHKNMLRRVLHYMPVPPASYNRQSWQRWLFEQVLLVEQHEACEFFTVEGVHPYAPNHGPGNDPYTIRELTTDEDRRTSYRGEIKT